MIMKTRLNLLAVCLSLFTVALFSGCGKFWVDPYITVDDSALNWIHIHYYNLARNPVMRYDVYLSGAGYVEVKKGRSQLVTNDFSKQDDDPNWSNIRTLRKDVDRRHVKDIFQHLVNNGVLDDVKFRRGTDLDKKDIKRFIAFRGNISNYAYTEQENVFETDPDLAEILLDVVWEFVDPTR